MSARLESGKFNLDKRGIFKNKMNIHHSQVPGQTNFLDFSLKAVKYKQDTDVIITGRSGWVCTHFSGIGLFVYKDLTTNTFSHWSSYSRPGNTHHHGSSSRVNTSYFWSINSDEWPDHEDQDCHHFCTKTSIIRMKSIKISAMLPTIWRKWTLKTKEKWRNMTATDVYFMYFQ